MPDGPVIEFHDVCFGYQRREVLHNVTFTVPDKALVAVVGPNGGGKTTLAKLCIGLLGPKYGTVQVLGQSPERVSHRVGYVPQQLQFDSAFPVSVLDVVLMGRAERHLFGPYRSEDQKAAHEALNHVGLQDFAGRAFAALSGGERQRVLIAQALASAPNLMVLDEPTANVDATVEHEIYDLLRELNKHMTVIAISHNLNVVTRYASFVMCVNRTASMMPMSRLDEENLAAVRSGDMTVLQHDPSCHVLDPSRALNEPHHSGHNHDGQEAAK